VGNKLSAPGGNSQGKDPRTLKLPAVSSFAVSRIKNRPFALPTLKRIIKKIKLGWIIRLTDTHKKGSIK